MGCAWHVGTANCGMNFMYKFRERIGMVLVCLGTHLNTLLLIIMEEVSQKVL